MAVNSGWFFNGDSDTPIKLLTSDLATEGQEKKK
jgi:hypothetical protein